MRISKTVNRTHSVVDIKNLTIKAKSWLAVSDWLYNLIIIILSTRGGNSIPEIQEKHLVWYFSIEFSRNSFGTIEGSEGVAISWSLIEVA